LADAKECLDVRKLSREEYLVYRHHKENEAYQRSVISTGYDDGMQDGIKKGRAEGRAEGDADRALADAKRFLDLGFSPEQVAKGTQLSLDTILSLVGKA
jgi:predicted transposase YdaD